MTQGNDTLQAAILARTGYQFNDVELLRQALTHGSKGKGAKDYERLEFLGDRVLSLVIAEALFSLHGKESEGRLAARHAALVRGEACAEIGLALNLPDCIILGAAEKKSGMHGNKGVLSDVVEALIAAIYLDGGFQTVKEFVLRSWDSMLKQPDTWLKDAKTFVQEWALGRALPLPTYVLVGREGPEHKPVFRVEVHVKKYAPAIGEGATKQMAEMAAAANLIARENLR